MILLRSFCIKFHLSNLGCIYFLIVHIPELISGTALDTWETKTEIPWYHRLSNLWLKGFLLLLGSWEWLLQCTRSNLEFSYNGLFNSPHKKTFPNTFWHAYTCTFFHFQLLQGLQSFNRSVYSYRLFGPTTSLVPRHMHLIAMHRYNVFDIKVILWKT